MRIATTILRNGLAMTSYFRFIDNLKAHSVRSGLCY